MIKVKDGYGKLIGTIYQGNPNYLLKADGGAWAVHTDRNDDPDKIVRTDASGYLQTGWINTTSGDIGTGKITRIYCSNDGYIRYKTPANFFSTLANNGDNISITVASQNRTLVVGYSKVAGQLRSKGTISPQTGRTQSLGDVYSYHLNGSVSGGPTTYASVIGFGRGTSGTVEIAGEWTSGRGLWVRALRDTTDNWYAWDKVLTQATYTGITDSRYYTKTQADERFVNITGDIMTGELINSSANAYRLKQSNYGVILRNDNNSFWILLTNSGSPSGSYNSLRPFRINLPDGRVTIGNGLSVTGTIVGSSTIQGTQLISTIANGTAPLKVTSKTVVTNLNSDLLDGYHETSFFRTRGSQTIASSIPTTTELSSNNNLSGNWNITFPGASGHLVQFNTGSGSTRYMQFYSYYSGSLYWRNSTDSTLSTKSWKTIVDSANYTGIVLKIGTATKGSATLPIYLNAGTPTACSTTLGVSITGNAATATKLQTARTINGTSFNGTANITTAYWGATRTITLSGAVTGSASVNGSQNVTITTTYQTGSIDGRYVGGKKAAGHGSQGTAYTADTYSSNFVNKAFVAYAERGSWAYANNGYITTDTGVNIPLAGTAIFQWGASDTNKTQLFITPHNNSGVSNPATNEMLFYTSNGSGYTSAWTRVLTHRNYTTYTVTKTGGGASGTWGISITGTAAAARKIYKIDGTSRTWSTANSIVGNGLVGYADTSTSGRWDSYGSIFQFSNLDNPTPGTSNHWLTQIWSGTSNKLGVRWRTNTGGWSAMQTILTNTNYVSYADTRYVTALGTNGNYVTWTKNGATNNLTVPYATASIRVNSSSSVQNTGLTYYSSGSFVVGGTAAGGQWGMPSDSQDASYKNGQCLRMYWGSTYYTDILSGPNSMGTTHGLYLRQIVNGSVATGTFPGGWRLLLDSYNYQRYGDSRYVTLATNQTVSGIKTFSKQQKFTVATGTSPFTVSSTTVVSNLNADMLDGTHKSGLLTSVTSTSATNLSIVVGGTTKQVVDLYANYAVSAGNADKLDGFHANTSQNPFGKIPTIGSGGVMEVGRYLDFHYNSSDTSDYRTRLQINHSSGSYTAILPAKSGTLAMTSDIPTVTNYYWANVRVSSSSSTGTSPTFSTAYTSNWFRSNGNTGWRSESYGGGWYMTDSTWIRTYGSKSVYQNTGQIRTDGYLVTNGGITIGATSPNNGTYKLYCNGQSYHRGDSYYTAAIRLNNRGNNSIYCGPNDAANTIGGALNNLVLSSWNGVSFTTSCSGQTCTNKNAVSINCRTGQLNAYQVYANGFHHRFMDSNNYVLLAGGSYKNLADFAKGNAGSSTQGVYVTGGTVKAMTYSLKATVNSGSSGKLAYYSGTNSIDDYTSTKGSSSTPIYLNAGVPTACSGVIVKYWGWYNINCYSSTTPSYSKKGGNFNFVTSISRRSEGKYTLGTVYPSGYTWDNTIYWGSGRLNKSMSSNSSNSVLYVTMFKGYQSGSTRYLYVNTADDSSTNDGYFDVFFLCF